jgi:hypothetical protein
MRQLDRIMLSSATVTSEGISNKGEHLTFQELCQINRKFYIARLLGPTEEKGYGRLNWLMMQVTANAPNLPLKMDLSALQRYLPSEQDSIDMLPDYKHWWKRSDSRPGPQGT